MNDELKSKILQQLLMPSNLLNGSGGKLFELIKDDDVLFEKLAQILQDVVSAQEGAISTAKAVTLEVEAATQKVQKVK